MWVLGAVTAINVMAARAAHRLKPFIFILANRGVTLCSINKAVTISATNRDGKITRRSMLLCKLVRGRCSNHVWHSHTPFLIARFRDSTRKSVLPCIVPPERILVSAYSLERGAAVLSEVFCFPQLHTAILTRGLPQQDPQLLDSPLTRLAGMCTTLRPAYLLPVAARVRVLRRTKFRM